MDPGRRAWWQAVLVGLDLVALVAVWAMAPALRDAVIAVWPFDLVPGDQPVLRGVSPALARAATVVVVGAWLGVLAMLGRYRTPLARPRVGPLLGAAMWSTLAAFALLYAVKLPELSRSLIVGFAGLAVPVLACTTALTRGLARLPMGARQQVALVGSVEAAAAADARFRRHPEWRMEVAGKVAGGDVAGLARLVDSMPLDAVHVVGTDVLELAPIAKLCADLGLTLTVDASDWRTAVGVERSEAGITVRFASERAPAMRVKRGVDVVGAAILLAMSAPLLLVLACAVRLQDGGPAFFAQTRVGRHGRPFRMWKLRTMVPDAERSQAALAPRSDVDGPMFKLQQDPRVTPLGRWLRRASLDELPQLWHVLTGAMSLVGPRPALPDEVACYATAQRRRLAMRPGLTGLWQVSGRSTLPFEEGMALDLAYVDGWTLAQDLSILLRTVPAVFSRRGAW